MTGGPDFKPPEFTTEQVLERLDRLWIFLDGEGWHKEANTVCLAIEEIKKPRPAALGF